MHNRFLRALLRAPALLLAATLLAACGGGEGLGGLVPQSDSAAPVTFAFRVRGAGPEQEFRHTTTDPALIANARAQLQLPLASRTLFPAGPIASGNGGVNPGWDWHYTSLSLVEVSIALCDGLPSMVNEGLSYWLGTVKSFCPWGGYVHAEVPTYRLADFAVGHVREIPAENLRVEFKDVSDSRCPAAAVCLAAVHQSFARVDLLVTQGSGTPVPVSVTLGAGPRDREAQALGYRFFLEALEPYPQIGPWPKEQYRARIIVTK